MEILLTIVILVIIIFSIMIHEVAHGSVAYYLGDTTARDSQRLNLNPLNHLDPFGSFLLPIILLMINSPFIVGWAKPVPVDFYNLSDKRWGALKVSLAGPVSNLLIAIIFGLFFRIPFNFNPNFYLFLQLVVFYNIILAVFNLMPIPPLDGSHILFDLLGNKFEALKIFLTQFGLIILLFLLYFGGNFIYTISQSIYYFITGVPPLI
jgi:Zn-dependent protease